MSSFRLDNVTQNSVDQGDGESYSASFALKSHHEDEHFKEYNGILRGKGPLHLERCIVKKFKKCQGEKSLCIPEIMKSWRVRELADVFKNGRDFRISFTKIRHAQMHSIAKRPGFEGKRPLSLSEYMLLEEHVGGLQEKITAFMDSCGRNSLPICLASKRLDAFTHFTYHYTEGQFVVCGLRGIDTGKGFSLMTPVIHSTNKEFGVSDRGEQGIKEVFQHHVCNEICHGWLKPGEGARCQGHNGVVQGSRPVSQRLQPTAPEYPMSINHPSQMSRTKFHMAQTISSHLQPSAPPLDEPPSYSTLFTYSPPSYFDIFPKGDDA